MGSEKPDAPPELPPHPPMTAEEALAAAAREGLTLPRSDNAQSGYLGVSVTEREKGRARPYKAEMRRDGKPVCLGCFTTPEEAALRLARGRAELQASFNTTSRAASGPSEGSGFRVCVRCGGCGRIRQLG